MEANINIVLEENEGGGLKLEFTRIENLREPIVEIDGYVKQNIHLKEGASIYVAKFYNDSLQFSSSEIKKNGSYYDNHSLKAYVPKDSADKRLSFETMRNNRYLVIYHTMGGKRFVLGDKSEGCKFSFKVNHGNSRRMNKTEIEFSYKKHGVLPEVHETVINSMIAVDDATHALNFKPFG